MTREIDPTPRRRARRYIEPLTLVLGLVTAAAAIIVPLYVFSASEQHAVLTVRYTASQALVNVDPRSANNVRVTYEGSEVRIPWLLSLRVENTGDKPIDSKDIKDNLSITFPQAQILRAQLTEKHPKEISSKIDINTNTLSVVFDLLNPQYNLSFDALLNGEPWNASTSFRMIGKYALVEVPFTQKPSQPFVTWPRVSSDVQVWILVFATGALAILFSFSVIFSSASFLNFCHSSA